MFVKPSMMKKLSRFKNGGFFSLTQTEDIYLPFQGKAVSHTNLMIHLNRVLSKYELEMKDKEEEDDEIPRAESVQKIYRLDRKDREEVVQDACEVYDLSEKEEFLQRCTNLGIPPFAMTYFLDNLSRGVTDLVLRNLGIGARGAFAVTEVLAGNSNIRSLDMSLNNIQDKGTSAVANLLETNRSIKKLNLSENLIGKEGVDSISNILTYNSVLTHLDLSRNNLSCKDIQFLSNVMQTVDSIRVLDLRHNAFRSKGGKYLGDMLGKNTSLSELYIGWNYFGDEGLRFLCSGLKNNRSLEVLDVCWNNIGHEGAECISEFLENNGRLLELNLDNNHITDKGLTSIAKGLQVNETLKILRVGFNVITSNGANKILESLVSNPGTVVEKLHIAEVEVTTKFEKLFWELKKRNPKFIALELNTPGGEMYHFETPPNAMDVLDRYLEQNGLNIDVSDVQLDKP